MASGNPDLERRAQELLDALGPRLLRGENVDREGLLREHPEIRSRLEVGLAAYDRLLADLACVPALVPSDPIREGMRFGDFVIHREVGRGGMGVVYEATRVPVGRRVALKVMPRLCALDPRRLTRFQREAQAAAALRHPAIVPVHDLGTIDGIPFLVMDLVEGDSLAQRLPPLSARNTPWPRDHATWAARVALQVAKALAYAHEGGVLHRDVKPSNILLADDQPLLTDFGLAWLEGSPELTASGEYVGTPRYSAPEQHESLAVGPEADVWAVGATLYEMLALRPAFDGRTLSEVRMAVLEGEPIRLRRLRPNVPRDLETIVAKCLEKKPRDRYRAASGLAWDLQAFLENRPISARSRGPASRSWMWVRRHRRGAFALAAGLLVAAVVLGIQTFRDAHTAAEELRRHRLATLEGAVAHMKERTPELSLLALVEAFGAVRTEPQAHRLLVDAGHYLLFDHGFQAAATRIGSLVLDSGADPLMAAKAEELLGHCAFYRIDLDAAAMHWSRAEELGGPSSALLRSQDLVRTLSPIVRVPMPRSESTGTTQVRDLFCADLNGDQRDELVAALVEGASRNAQLWWWSHGPAGPPTRLQIRTPKSSQGIISWIGPWRRGRGQAAGLLLFMEEPPDPGGAARTTLLGAVPSGTRGEQGDLEVLWRHDCLGRTVIGVACGDLDGDGDAELAVLTDENSGLFVLNVDGNGHAVPVPFGESGRLVWDLDLTGATIGALSEPPHEELLLTTKGHELFGLIRLRMSAGRLERVTGDLSLGALYGSLVFPGASPKLLVARGFTPSRPDVTAGLVEGIDAGPGLYMVDVGRQRAVSWTGSHPGLAMLRQAPWGQVAEPKNLRLASGASALLAHLRLRFPEPEGAQAERRGLVVLSDAVDRSHAWIAAGYRARNVQVGNLDGDPASELILSDDERVSVLGVNAQSPPGVSNAGPRPKDPSQVEREETARLLLELALEIGKRGEGVSQLANACLAHLRRIGRPGLARDLWRAWHLAAWFPAAASRTLEGDLAFLTGSWREAAQAYPGIGGAAEPSDPRPLLPEVSPRRCHEIATWLAREPMATAGLDPGVIGTPQVAELGAVNRCTDPTGLLGGRYGEHRSRPFWRLAGEATGGEALGPVLAALIPPPHPWKGARPLRLQTRLLVQYLDFGARLEVALHSEASNSAPPAAEPWVRVELAHLRTGALRDGDWYGMRVAARGLEATRSPDLWDREFVLGQWMELVLVYIPEIQWLRVELSFVDRRRGLGRIALATLPVPWPALERCHAWILVRAPSASGSRPGSLRHHAELYVDGFHLETEGR